MLGESNLADLDCLDCSHKLKAKVDESHVSSHSIDLSYPYLSISVIKSNH